MFDASAKISSGLLNGNINSFGDFDECLNVKSSGDVGSQYCMAYVDIDVPDEMVHLKQIKKLSHSMETFKSNFSRGLNDVRRFNCCFFFSFQ